jgi:hypothetical protein
MGAEEKARLTQNLITRAAMERMLGDPRPFGTYDSGCPKCGSTKDYHKPNYCFGEQKLIEELPCKIFGEHLHTVCTVCNHVWLQRCRDWDLSDERPRIEEP